MRGAAHERVRQLGEQPVGRRPGQRQAERAADRDVEREPEARVLGGVVGDVVRHPRARVEVDEVRGAVGVGESAGVVDDELEAAGRARQRVVLERADERLAGAQRKRPGAR